LYRHFSLAFTACCVACQSSGMYDRATEHWSFLPIGQFRHWSPTERDTATVEFKEGTVTLRFSNRRSGDTVFFAILSGIRIGTPGEDESRDLAPGEGFIVDRSGVRDSVFFEAGAADFRGTATDVFMSGSFDLRLKDSTITIIPPKGGGQWRMAMISRDTLR